MKYSASFLSKSRPKLQPDNETSRVSLQVRTDNEAACLSVQGEGLVIGTITLSVQVDIVIRTIKDVRINFSTDSESPREALWGRAPRGPEGHFIGTVSITRH